MSENEKTLERQIEEVAINAMNELRDTLRPNFDYESLGYSGRHHARGMIVRMADKQIYRLCAAIFKRDGR